MKAIRFGAALLTIALFSTQLQAQKKNITSKELPKKTQSFISSNFKSKISYAEAETKISGKEYDVVLADGTKLEFSTSGDWTEIENKATGVPEKLLPAKIATYIKKNYKGIVVEKIEKERYGFSVDLANDIDLEFNKNGDFIRIDY